MFRYQADNNILQHKYTNYHVKLKQPTRPLAVAGRDCKTCKVSQNCSLISEDFFILIYIFNPIKALREFVTFMFQVHVVLVFSLYCLKPLSPNSALCQKISLPISFSTFYIFPSLVIHWHSSTKFTH